MKKMLFAILVSCVFVSTGCSDSSDSGGVLFPITPAVCTIEKPMLDFGTVNLGSSATIQLAITCSEPASLSISTSIGCNFSIQEAHQNLSVAAGEVVKIDVIYSPTAVTADMGYIAIANTGNGQKYEAIASGKCSSPTPTLKYTYSILSNDVYENVFNFQQPPVNTSRIGIAELLNHNTVGGDDVVIQGYEVTKGINTPDAYTVRPISDNMTIKAGESFKFEITYTPYSINYEWYDAFLKVKYTRADEEKTFQLRLVGSTRP